MGRGCDRRSWHVRLHPSPSTSFEVVYLVPRGYPPRVIVVVGDGSIGASLPTTVTMVDTSLRVRDHGYWVPGLIVYVTWTEIDAESALCASVRIDYRVPFFGHGITSNCIFSFTTSRIVINLSVQFVETITVPV